MIAIAIPMVGVPRWIVPPRAYWRQCQVGAARRRFPGPVVLAAVTLLAMIAPARAQWPQPSSSELFGRFDCRIATAPTCICSQDNGSHEVVYQQLLAVVAAYPVRTEGEADRKSVQSKWRRQCGLIEQADTTP